MAGITWLHLSDWHEGAEDFDRDLVRFDRETVLRKLIEDISDRKKISPELSQIDFIVFSGDVAFSGKKTQYDAARENFFDKILQAAGLCNEKGNPLTQRLFVVPGNHDLDRDIVQDQDYPPFLKAPFGSHDEFKNQVHVKKRLTDEKKRQRLLDPFADFKNFATQYNTEQERPDYASTQILDNIIDGKRVGLLGINSALMAGRENLAKKVQDKGNLIVGEPQIQSGFQKVKNCDVRLAVLHHPFDWLDDDDYNGIEKYLREFHFVLCGHRHISKTIQVAGTVGKYLTISAGASYSSRDYSNGYNFVHFDPDRGRGSIYLRRWDDEIGEWIKAPFLGEEGEVVYTGCFKFPPPPPPLPLPPLPPPYISVEEKLLPEERTKQLEEHYEDLVTAITEGTVVAVLGADINLCGRSQEQLSPAWDWKYEGKCPPTNPELAVYIDREFGHLATDRCPLCPGNLDDSNFPGGFPPNCPLRTKHITRLDLPYISQYLRMQQDTSKLREIINKIHGHSYTPNLVHEFLATKLIKYYDSTTETNPLHKTKCPLIVTTCFDSTLEFAFQKAKQPYDLVAYSDKTKSFEWQRNELITINHEEVFIGTKTSTDVIKEPDFFLEHYPVILRLYGPAAWQQTHEGENFAITEDHFLTYLIRIISSKFPKKLSAKLGNSHLWFLGYSLSYWHLRILLRQIMESKSESKLDLPVWWSVQHKPEAFDKGMWDINDVPLFSHISIDPSNMSIDSLKQYIIEVGNRLEP